MELFESFNAVYHTGRGSSVLRAEGEEEKTGWATASETEEEH